MNENKEQTVEVASNEVVLKHKKTGQIVKVSKDSILASSPSWAKVEVKTKK